MDTAQQATAATKQRDAIQKKLTALDQQYRETESALTRERSTHASLTAKRAKLLEELPGADDATSGWAHGKIDGLESKLHISSRVMEGLQSLLSRLAGEKSAMASEFAQAQETCEQERRTLVFSELQAQIWARRRAAEDAAAALRVALFELNRTAVQGIKDCGPQAQGLAEFVISEFQHQQHNPDTLLGWQLRGFELWGNLRFTIQPAFQPKAKG
jgi:chromosome segregation ATPase